MEAGHWPHHLGTARSVPGNPAVPRRGELLPQSPPFWRMHAGGLLLLGPDFEKSKPLTSSVGQRRPDFHRRSACPLEEGEGNPPLAPRKQELILNKVNLPTC